MSAQQFHAEVMSELQQRETEFVCYYCGNPCGAHEPSTFICCGEIGHCHEVDCETGEPVGDIL